MDNTLEKETTKSEDLNQKLQAKVAERHNLKTNDPDYIINSYALDHEISCIELEIHNLQQQIPFVNQNEIHSFLSEYGVNFFDSDYNRYYLKLDFDLNSLQQAIERNRKTFNIEDEVLIKLSVVEFSGQDLDSEKEVFGGYKISENVSYDYFLESIKSEFTFIKGEEYHFLVFVVDSFGSREWIVALNYNGEQKFYSSHGVEGNPGGVVHKQYFYQIRKNYIRESVSVLDC